MMQFYDRPRHYRTSSVMTPHGKDTAKTTQSDMVDLGRYAQIGAVIDVLGTYALGVPTREVKEYQEFFLSSLRLLPLDDFSLLEASLRVEPPQ